MADSDSANNFAALPPRQKITALIFMMIAVFVVWEVIGMFRGGGDRGAAVAPAQPVAPPAGAPKSAPSPEAHPGAMPAKPTAPAPATAHLPPQLSRPQVDAAPPPSPALVQQEQAQTKYVSALNELQMLKIQKEIAETSQAIVAAKLATATAERGISDLLSEAESISLQASNKAAASNTAAPPAPAQPEVRATTYSVQSVTMEQDQWHAVVKYKDKYYDVSVGDMLPPDNSTVKAIDQRGVLLEYGGLEVRVPLTVTDLVPGPKENNLPSPGNIIPPPSPPS